MKVYTKTGDKGDTALLGGIRVPKSHIRIEAYGTVDELNSYVGLVRDQSIDAHYKSVLTTVQERLFTLGATLATAPSKTNVVRPDLLESDITLLETEIDTMEGTLPPLQNFILPGGHTTVSYAHLARCVCRRAERLAVALSEIEPLDGITIQYLNRLSDYFFVLGRKLALDLNADEIPWKPRG